jgi:hypothetical protein
MSSPIVVDEVTCRFRAIAELLADPALAVYKNAVPGAISPAARGVLRRHCRALLDHCWAGVEAYYGVRRGQPFCVVYQGTRLSLVMLTTDAERAVAAAANWHGASDDKPSIAVVQGDSATVFELNGKMELVRLSRALGLEETWVALPAALAYTKPVWVGNHADARPDTGPAT